VKNRFTLAITVGTHACVPVDRFPSLTDIGDKQKKSQITDH